MKSVLILSDINFWEDSSGNRARLKALIAYLAPLVNLTVVNTGPAPKGITERLRSEYPAEFHVLNQKSFMSSNGYGRRLEKLVGDREFDVVIIEYIHSSYFLNFLNGEPKIILDAHDIISERAEEFKKFNYSAEAIYELPEAQEREILDIYDHVIAICGPDKQKLDTMLSAEKVLLCPHPVPAVGHVTRDVVANISFVASAYLPNRDSVNYFIRECWPSITTKYPHVRLAIYGTVCGSVEVAGNENISLMGFVPDLNSIYEKADIMINPIRFGAGMKIKNIEALAHGIPLITTTHGARGLEPVIGKAFFTADTPADFIVALSSLIENYQLRKQLSTEALKFIKENFSADKCFGPLIDAINSA